MAGGERSKGGCWTCKARKKKCDEGHASCATCLSLGINCYGYGPRPAWMDGGSAEKAKLDAWRQKVKEITNHRRKLRARQSAPRSAQSHHSPENNHIPIFPITVEDAILTPESLPPPAEDFSPALNKTPIPRWLPGRSEDSFQGIGKPAQKFPIYDTDTLERVGSSQPPVLCEEEAILLMHYLDQVFPLQFPFYKHSSIKGGRGWLLSLLTQLEPLYHAVLSISSYHKHFEEFTHQYELQIGSMENVRELPACPRLESQLTEHNLTLSSMGLLVNRLEDLKRNRSELPLPEYIELIACMATLISLEVRHIPISLVFIHA